MKFLLSRKIACWLFYLSCGGIILPSICLIFLILIAKGLDCEIINNPNSFCQSLGQVIQQILKFNINFILWNTYTLGLPLWLILGFIHYSWRRWEKIWLSLGSIWLLPHLPLIFSTLATITLIHEGCQYPSGKCLVFDTEMSSQIYAPFVLPWLLFITLPVCGLVSILYPGRLVAILLEEKNQA